MHILPENSRVVRARCTNIGTYTIHATSEMENLQVFVSLEPGLLLHVRKDVFFTPFIY